MTSHQLDEERIFHTARKLPDAESRSDYLDQVCSGDQALRERVEALLEVHEEEQSFLNSNGAADPTKDHATVTEQPGQQIGRYKLLQKIGEGGFGVVYMAEQARPVRRKVALKIIKPGMDTKAVVARFEAERQALALMDHSNIARVLDGGTTDSGRPFFVMELVKGVPITEYCDKNQLATIERLKLFVTVCQAVQHAHQKGIIHRDIKPSNVLVTLHDGQPMIKVIDFGVAKAINQQLTEKTLFTAFGQMIGTPQYMSPEQAEMSGLDVDTRSDIYSLGVLLYELLTGTTPLECEQLRTAGYAEMQRLIREDEPPKPSTRLSSAGKQLTIIAKHRNLSPDQLQRTVRGDLDWIVMKSLEKDRSRRYETPSSMADDVERIFSDEPVEACPPSSSYRMWKFVRRNRSLVTAASVVAAVLLIGCLGTASGLLWAVAEKGRAERNAADLSKKHLQLVDSERAARGARESAEDALQQLGEQALRLALVHALNGNRREANSALSTARQARIEESRLKVVEAALDVYAEDNRLDRAFETLRALTATNDSVAAQALFTNALLWSGREGLDRHYAELVKLRDMPPVRQEDYLFKGQAIGRIDADEAIELLEFAVSNTKSPVARVLLAQAYVDKAIDEGNVRRCVDAYRQASAAHVEMPDSSMARAIHLATCYHAWRLGGMGQADWYLAEARRLAEEIDESPTVVERLVKAGFLAFADSAELEAHDELLLRRGMLLWDASARQLRRAPSSYDVLVQQVRQHFDSGNDQWFYASNALNLLRALSPVNHDEAREAIESYDATRQLAWPLDPRISLLISAMLMDGRDDYKVKTLVRHMRQTELKSFYQPHGVYDYVDGLLDEAQFLSRNEDTLSHRSAAEFFVAIVHLSQQRRNEALSHFRAVVEHGDTLIFHWWAVAFHDLLESQDPLLNWLDDRSRE